MNPMPERRQKVSLNSQDNENSACLQEETNQKYYNAFRQQFGKKRSGYLPTLLGSLISTN